MSKYQDTDSFYKDKLNKKISGICAGLAKSNNFPIWSVRLATLLLFFMFPVAVLIGYFIGALVLPERY
ncbi:PspC domain-containing protein [Pseudoalteromonas denitrificans]|uniref:Phage shock protein C (PspC) family protein n=1 Tax=Pseudoalteromonas denitrificans DSM 6059 TaxID=1123010 RepID=A0A1I1PCP8_9GAMM|nr:PspC domain-containing protein [Pseudoalteromonas denitrificans]SFD07731.1 phage shock protein C (PspC) family protein [Pseudoalteromonas denitrificans DSM 6059]